MRRSSKIESEEDLQGLGYYSNVALSRRKIQTFITIGLLTAVWYLCAVVTITTTKQIMNQMKFPYLLSSIQFVFASVLSFLYLYFTKTYVSIPSGVVILVLQIAVSYTFGFILTNSAFSLGKS